MPILSLRPGGSRLAGAARGLVLAAALLGGAVAAAAGELSPDSGGADSLRIRLDRIQRLLGEAGAELDSLRSEMARRPPAAAAGTADTGAVAAPPAAPLALELLSRRQSALARASRTGFNRWAAGYSWDPHLTMGMDAIAWSGPWGAKLEAAFHATDGKRLAGGSAVLLRSLHRFTLLQDLQTHLYAFAGPGLFWRREEFFTHGFPQPGPPRRWFENPDQYATFKLGAGTELGILVLGGIRVAPEVGMAAARYFDRHQDSPSWRAQMPAIGEPPKSDFDLNAYFAFHLNCYFL